MLGAGVVVGGVANRKGKGWVGRHAIRKKRGDLQFFFEIEKLWWCIESITHQCNESFRSFCRQQSDLNRVGLNTRGTWVRNDKNK